MGGVVLTLLISNHKVITMGKYTARDNRNRANKKKKRARALWLFKLECAGLTEFTASHKPKGLGRGLQRVDRVQREGLLYKSNGGMHYLPRDLGNANMKVVIHKVLNNPSSPYEHLSLNWLN